MNEMGFMRTLKSVHIVSSASNRPAKLRNCRDEAMRAIAAVEGGMGVNCAEKEFECQIRRYGIVCQVELLTVRTQVQSHLPKRRVNFLNTSHNTLVETRGQVMKNSAACNKGKGFCEGRRLVRGGLR